MPVLTFVFSPAAPESIPPSELLYAPHPVPPPMTESVTVQIEMFSLDMLNCAEDIPSLIDFAARKAFSQTSIMHNGGVDPVDFYVGKLKKDSLSYDWIPYLRNVKVEAFWDGCPMFSGEWATTWEKNIVKFLDYMHPIVSSVRKYSDIFDPRVVTLVRELCSLKWDFFMVHEAGKIVGKDHPHPED